MITAQQVDILPGPGWRPEGALNLPDAWFLIDLHRPQSHPMSTAMYVTIFFEETACCNMVQGSTPAGIGPGQLQVSEQGKVDFFAAQGHDNSLGEIWDSSLTVTAVNQLTGQVINRHGIPMHPELAALTQARILNDNEFAIKMHVKFFDWLVQGFGADGHGKSLQGLLDAQTGGDTTANNAFLHGENELLKMMQPAPKLDHERSGAEWKTYYEKKRMGFILALNTARREFKKNPVPPNRKNFWEFFVPDEFLEDPLGYVKYGF